MAKFKKGHIWCLGTSGVHLNPTTNPNPEVFNFDRFRQGKMHPDQENYLNPQFGYGKRICIGYQIAELFLKMVFMYFSSAFKLEKGPDYSPEVQVDVTQCLHTFNVNLQCREEFWKNIDSY